MKLNQQTTFLALVASAATLASAETASIAAAGSWSAGASWAGGVGPASFNTDLDVTFDAAVTSTVDVASTVGRLTMGATAASNLVVDATLSVVEWVWTQGEVSMGANGKITGLTAAGGFTAGATLGASNDERIVTDGEIDFGISVVAKAPFAVGSNNQIQFQGTSLTNVDLTAGDSSTVRFTSGAEAATWTGLELTNNGGSSSTRSTYTLETTANLDTTATTALAVESTTNLALAASAQLKSTTESTKAAVSLAADAAIEVSASAAAEVRDLTIGMADSAEIAVRAAGSLVVAGDVTANGPLVGTAALNVEAAATLEVASEVYLDARGTVATFEEGAKLAVKEGAEVAFASADFGQDVVLEVMMQASYETQAAITMAGNMAIKTSETKPTTLKLLTSGTSNLKAGTRYQVMAFGSATGTFTEGRVFADGELVVDATAGTPTRRRLLDNHGTFEQDDTGVYYTPTQDSAAFGLAPGLAVTMAALLGVVALQ